jgi:hypothetical protein
VCCLSALVCCLSCSGSCLWFSRVLSRSFACVCICLACLACLWFSPSSDWYRTGFLYFSGVEVFWPTPLYKASMYIVRAFFFTQQFTLLLKLLAPDLSIPRSSKKDIAFGTRSSFSPLSRYFSKYLLCPFLTHRILIGKVRRRWWSRGPEYMTDFLCIFGYYAGYPPQGAYFVGCPYKLRIM